MISLTIPGKPISQARPRLCRNGHVFNPQFREKQIVSQIIATQITRQGVLSPLQGCISVEAYIHTSIPNSWSKKRLKNVLGKFDPTRPDIDNILKFYLDAMNGLVYQDDNQVTHLICEKRYSINPRVELMIQEIREEHD